MAKAAEAHKAGNLEEARQIYEAVLGKTIKDSYILYSLATIYLQLGLNGTAMNLFMRAHDEMPDDAEWRGECWMNLGVAYKHEAHDTEAGHCYREALNHIKSPNDRLLIYTNLAGLHVNAGAPKQGIDYARKALEIDPYYPEAGFHLGLALLEDHQYAEGWRWYNCRLRQKSFHVRPFECPMWEGEETDLLAIHAEQGIGDEILFASLIPFAQKRAKRVVVECTDRLIPIFERSFGVKCYATDAELLAAEKPTRWIAMGSLPNVFGIAAQIEHRGYLKPNPERLKHWHNTLPKGQLRVGVSWRGGTKKTHEHLRNFEVEQWLPLMKTPGVHFVNLQYGDQGTEPQRMGVHDYPCADFDDHIALVASCDLVISICNTTIHEAGATNTPCWCLVPNKPAWRYGTRGREMLWYPSVTLYRQKENWTDVIEALAADLRKLRGPEPEIAQGEAAIRSERPALCVAG